MSTRAFDKGRDAASRTRKAPQHTAAGASSGTDARAAPSSNDASSVGGKNQSKSAGAARVPAVAMRAVSATVGGSMNISATTLVQCLHCVDPPMTKQDLATHVKEKHPDQHALAVNPYAAVNARIARRVQANGVRTHVFTRTVHHVRPQRPRWTTARPPARPPSAAAVPRAGTA